MKVTVVGANGRVGQLVVRRALEHGHEVTAFVPSRDPFAGQHRLRVLAGDVADPFAVEPALVGCQAVISTLGASRRGTGPVLTPGMRTLTPGMQREGGRRLVTLTGAGLPRPGRSAGAPAGESVTLGGLTCCRPNPW